MKTLLRILFSIFVAIGAVTAKADTPSLVKYSTSGNGTYNVVGIQEFDWQSSGDLVIRNALPGAGSVANGVLKTTFAAWAAAAVVNDTVTFKVHSHARLNDMLNSAGGSVAPLSLSKDGATCLSGPCFEITIALTGEESATLVAPGVIRFDSLIGTYKIFHDSLPDSNVTTTSTQLPTNFSDGVVILEGTAVSIGGIFGNNVGSEIVSSAVPIYNANYIQTDSPPLVRLSSSTFDNLISLAGPSQAQVAIGQPSGLDPYIVLAADLRYKIDSNSEFGARPPEPLGACRVTGGGNDVDENLVISANENQPYPNTATLFPGYTFKSGSANSYTYGGQVGAPTVPFGEWTHHQKEGQTADFVFHAGSHSAPKDTTILAVVCSDPEACKAAVANASFKQIDFKGTGSFRSIKKDATINGFAAVKDSDPSGGTRHYFRVHIEDLGEPGGSGGPKPNSCNKKPGAFANAAACKNCPDIYQIEIHATTDPNSPIIYTVGAFVDGGNLQIHAPVK